MSAGTESWWPPAKPESLSDIRRGVRSFLRTSGVPAEMVDNVVLIVDELLANAIKHGEPDLKVTVGLTAGCVTGFVTDHGGGMPCLKRPRRTAQSGRGLRIVAELATEWHIERIPDGKKVCFTCCPKRKAAR